MQTLAKFKALPWRSAIAWLLLAGPAFFLFYGNANQYAASLPPDQVGHIVFAWERDAIPFWPWSIVPYWSIDLMFGVSLLLCANKDEVRTQALRLMLATLLSSICFVLWPLRFGWDRPVVDGLFGAMFAALGQIDQPFNQAPSLHISLLLIIWLRFAAFIQQPLARIVLHIWCFLIGISVLTTWQHHFIDIPTGFALGVLVCYLLPMPGLSWQQIAQWRANRNAAQQQRQAQLALRYGVGAASLLLLAVALQGWFWLLLWPAISLLLVALAYLGLGPSVFQKQNGKMSLAACCLLAPYHWGAALSSRYFLFRTATAVEVADGVWLGGRNAARDPRFGAVLDLCAEYQRQSRVIQYVNLPLLDLVPPNKAEIEQAVQAIDELRSQTTAPLLVHCALGFSRSATIVAAWLIHSGKAASLDDAVAQIRQLRSIHLDPEQIKLAWQLA